MTPDQMNPKICPAALDENGNNAFADDAEGGRHKWDTTTTPTTCSECGTEYEEMTRAQALDLVEMAVADWIDRANNEGETEDALAMAEALKTITSWTINE